MVLANYSLFLENSWA